MLETFVECRSDALANPIQGVVDRRVHYNLAMQRDLDLYRAILLEVENRPSGQRWPAEPLSGHTLGEVIYHIQLMQDAGLVDARVLNYEAAMILRMTHDGHDFLEASRQPSLWAKAKEKLQSAGLPLTIYALKTVLDALIKERLPH